ncbi:MAG: hypothetical protein VW454_00615 [Pelagibacteraceae bacterium]|tara:strand:+ start:202 stop:666 length:465 start_codon:yes stop_codon:yes gene_type:complete
MIIECKCKKYKFKIPDEEIIPPGRTLQCSICNEEWYQEFKINPDNTLNIKEDNQKDLLKEMNPSKNKSKLSNKKKAKEKKEKRSYLLILTLIFFLLIFIIYKLAFHYKDLVISSNPSLINFYESLEIITEILKANINFIKEITLEAIKKIQNKI